MSRNCCSFHGTSHSPSLMLRADLEVVTLDHVRKIQHRSQPTLQTPQGSTLQALKQTKVNKKSLLTYRHSLNPNLFNFQHIAACGHRWDDHGGFQTLKGQQSWPSCGTMLRLTSFVRSMGMPYFSPEVSAFEIELLVPLNHLGYLRCCCNLPKNMQ